MPRLLKHFVEAERACSYLPEASASHEHRVMVDVSPSELDQLLARGFRRFGPDYFRPLCRSCEACVATRIVVNDFTPSKSQRRARRQCEDLTIAIGVPQVDAARLELYRSWHEAREAKRAWESSPIDERDYRHSFAFPHPSAREVAYLDPAANHRLVAVGICDETPSAWSAVYFFYDPSYSRRSIGTANVVVQTEIARARGLRYLYLGYRVTECPSLRYKQRFQRQEVLVGRPALHEEPHWI